MKVTVKITKNFKSAAKPLLKKYHSLPKDLLKLEKELLQTPRLGISLGHDAFKIRLTITSKGKGKSKVNNAEQNVDEIKKFDKGAPLTNDIINYLKSIDSNFESTAWNRSCARVFSPACCVWCWPLGRTGAPPPCSRPCFF